MNQDIYTPPEADLKTDDPQKDEIVEHTALSNLRWLCIVPAIVFAFIVSIYLGGFALWGVMAAIGIVNEWAAIPVYFGLGGFAASVVVFTGYYVAPFYKRVAARLTYCVGLGLSLFLVLFVTIANNEGSLEPFLCCPLGAIVIGAVVVRNLVNDRALSDLVGF